MRIIQAIGIIIILSTFFLFNEYQEYNDLKRYKVVSSIAHKLCLSPEEHKNSMTAIMGSSENISPSCQEEINEKFRKNIFRMFNGDDLIFKY